MFRGNASSLKLIRGPLSCGSRAQGPPCLAACQADAPAGCTPEGRTGLNRNPGKRIAVGVDGLPRSSVLMAFLQGRVNQGDALPALRQEVLQERDGPWAPGHQGRCQYCPLCLSSCVGR